MGIEYRKSGQIPAFGDWDKANELPITQYFECARQAGLVRYSCSSGEYDHGGYVMSSNNWGGYGGANSDLYAVGYRKPPPLRSFTAPPKTSGVINKRPEVKEGRTRRVNKIREAMVEDKPKSQQQKQHFPRHSNHKSSPPTRRPAVAHQPPTPPTVKPLDEDLYKIPPHLLHKPERKKKLGFFSRCLVPPCKT